MKSPFKNALISVSDKTGLVEFIKPLAEKGMRVVSTGGTAEALRKAGIKVTDVSEQTGFPEVMDGRVKTLHPKVHMALLARSFEPKDTELLRQQNIEPFDLVIVNLYPFEQTLKRLRNKHEFQQQDVHGPQDPEASKEEAQLIENIDIGGPSLLRGAAKSFERLCVVVDPNDYAKLSERGLGSREQRKHLAAKAFAHVSSYDAMISHTLGGGTLYEKNFSLGGELVQELRYGENPHQKAQWYKRRGAMSGWHEAEVLQGKELSYNNLLDLEAALGLVNEFPPPFAVTVAVKHNSPCGVAQANHLFESAEKCVKADPVSVFGGIIATNQTVDGKTAELLANIFLECVVAPDFSSEALEIFKKKKNLRLLKWPSLQERDPFPVIKTIQGGFLVQESDRVKAWSKDWKVLRETPNQHVQLDLETAWKVCAHLKSNAIAVVGSGQTLGLGMGQVNRVDAVEQALERLKKFHSHVPNAVLASDAFFPFVDSIERIAKAGIRWVIQPGGSLKDEEVFQRAQELGVNLIITGQRHFRH